MFDDPGVPTPVHTLTVGEDRDEEHTVDEQSQDAHRGTLSFPESGGADAILEEAVVARNLAPDVRAKSATGAMALVAGGSLVANMCAIHETSVLSLLPRSTIGFLGSCQQEPGKHPGWNARVRAWLANSTRSLLGFLGSCYLLIK